MNKNILQLVIRTAITVFAFWYIGRSIDFAALKAVFKTADAVWLSAGTAIYGLAVFLGIARWKILCPNHPSLTWGFLSKSFIIATFFNTILPTTVGGDVVRGYDLIKATGKWQDSLASLLMDRIMGISGAAIVATITFVLFNPAQGDPFIQKAFFGFLVLVLSIFAVLSSKKILGGMLKPFHHIGLGQIGAHAEQFQNSLLDYLKRPKQVFTAFAVSCTLLSCMIFLFAAFAEALHLDIPLGYLIVVVPLIITISQVPVSLNGWGIREGATIFFLGRIGIAAEAALSLSLLCALMTLLSGLAGGILFLVTKGKKKKKPRPE